MKRWLPKKGDRFSVIVKKYGNIAVNASCCKFVKDEGAFIHARDDNNDPRLFDKHLFAFKIRPES